MKRLFFSGDEKYVWQVLTLACAGVNLLFRFVTKGCGNRVFVHQVRQAAENDEEENEK